MKTHIDAPTEKVKDYLLARERLAEASAKKLQRYLHDPVAFLNACIEFPEGERLLPYQEEIIDSVVEYKKVAVRAPHGAGKDLDVETPIPIPTGWTTMGELRAGDVVFNEDGEPTTVTYAEDPQWREAFRVCFADDSEIIAGAGHLWSAIDLYHRPGYTERSEGKRTSRHFPVDDWREFWGDARTTDTQTIAARLRSPGGQLRWRIPTARPLERPEADLPIDPYLLGMFLADGSAADGLLTLNREDAPEIEARLGPSHRIPSAERPGSVGVRVDGLFHDLRVNGLMGNKHIPMLYLRASEAQRRVLLRGLMDGDGFIENGGRNLDGVDLCNKQLAADTCELIRTLGVVVRVSEEPAKIYGRVVGTRWRINARFDECPFTLRRYVDRWTPRGSQASRHTQRTIVSCEPVGKRLTRCIAVDSPRHLFLAGEAMIPTHNSTTAALLVLWHALTRDAVGMEWKCIMTAGAWRQLERFLLPELHKWARAVRWDQVGRPPFTREELLRLNLNLNFGAASAAAATNPAFIEGAHADSVLFIYDEAKALSDGIFIATAGAFSGAGVNNREAFALAISTPGEPVGYFYDIHNKKAGLESWHTRHITLDEAIEAGRVAPDFVEEKRREWGSESQIFYNRILGEFHSSDDDSIIPLAWVEAAQDRWYQTQEEKGERVVNFWPIDRIGVDVAASGGDTSVIARVRGVRVDEILYYPLGDTVDLEERIYAARGKHDQCIVTIDADGVGVGVFDHVRDELGADVVKPFHASEKTSWKEVSKELVFLNTRAAAWWSMRELLDPKLGATLELPDDDRLLTELITPKWEEQRGSGKIKVELKDDIRKRLGGRSTDAADAVILALWVKRKKRRRAMVHVGGWAT